MKIIVRILSLLLIPLSCQAMDKLLVKDDRERKEEANKISQQEKEQYLHRLLLMNIGNPAFDYQTKHSKAMLSKTNFLFGNSMCSTKDLTQEEIQEVLKQVGSNQLSWFIDSADTSTMSVLSKNGLKQVADFPAMIVDLKEVESVDVPKDVILKEVTQENLQAWISIAARNFSIDEKEFSKYVQYILSRSKLSCTKLYLANYKGIPVATSMVICGDKTASIHWISTNEDYRGKGIGSAISRKPLLDAREYGCTQAILIATQLGKPVYEKIGYKAFAHYNVFGR